MRKDASFLGYTPFNLVDRYQHLEGICRRLHMSTKLRDIILK